MTTPEKVVLAWESFQAVLCAHLVYYNIGLFDDYILGGFFYGVFSGLLHFRFPSFRFQSLKLPSFSLPRILSRPTFKLPSFRLPTFELPTFKLPAFEIPAFELPTLSLPSAGFLSFINSCLSSLAGWAVFITKWTFSTLIPWILFPPIFAFIIGILYLNVLDIGKIYTMTYHGEHSRVSFEVVTETFVTPLIVLALIYNFINWLRTPRWPLIESLLLEWLIRLCVGLAHVGVMISSFILDSFERVCNAYTWFDLVEARLRMPNDTWNISETWRHTKLSRFLQRCASWTFENIGPLVPFYGPGHPKRNALEHDLRFLQFSLRARLMADLGIQSEETVDAIRQLRAEHWYLP
ncbi:hypothetical protein F5Y13DRAFT_154088 [Hypoxylon sp. FL1857]|nr:hypothetical protein F5Y13DRAFT_154088 [Hypoxylon sp. FL1857]